MPLITPNRRRTTTPEKEHLMNWFAIEELSILRKLYGFVCLCVVSIKFFVVFLPYFPLAIAAISVLRTSKSSFEKTFSTIQ